MDAIFEFIKNNLLLLISLSAITLFLLFVDIYMFIIVIKLIKYQRERRERIDSYRLPREKWLKKYHKRYWKDEVKKSKNVNKM